MKGTLVIALFFIFPLSIAAQENDDMETLFGSSKDLKIGVYGGPEAMISQINGEVGLMVGGRGGIILNESFFFGGSGVNIVTLHTADKDSELYKLYDIENRYGGFLLEYINNTKRLFHFTSSMLIGWGNVALRADNPDDITNNWIYANDSYFIIEPRVAFELNVHEYFRINMGVSYKLVAGADIGPIDSSDLSGLSANVVLKFGFFDKIELPDEIQEIIEEHN